MVTDRYAAYNRVPCKREFCYEHLKRDSLKLLDLFSESEEVQKFVAIVVDLLRKAISLRTRAITDEVYYKKAKALEKRIKAVMEEPAGHAGYTLYFPTTDEFYQLSSAKRIALGLGYTYNFSAIKNLPDYGGSFIGNWPIGYSLLMSCFVKLGVSLSLASKLLKILLILVGLVLWGCLVERILFLKACKSVFLLMLTPLALRFSSSQTDLFLWAFFPVLPMVLIDEEVSKLKFALLSLILTCLILIKYLAAMIPFGIIIWILLFKKNKPLWGRIFDSVALSALPMITIFVLIIINFISANHNLNNLPIINVRGIADFKLNFILALFYPFIPLTSDALDFILMHYPMMIGFISTIFSAFLVYSIFIAYLEASTKKICSFFLVIFSALLTLLALLTVINPTSNNWTFLSEPRYYFFVTPFFLLFMLSCLKGIFNAPNFQSKIRHRVVYGLIGGIIFLFSAEGFTYVRYRQYSDLNRIRSVIANEIERIPTNNNDIKGRIVYAEPSLINVLFDIGGIDDIFFAPLDNTLIDNIYCSRQTRFILIAIKNNFKKGQFIEAGKKNRIIMHGCQLELIGWQDYSER